jgi:hypothetical protein
MKKAKLFVSRLLILIFLIKIISLLVAKGFAITMIEAFLEKFNE